MFLLRIHSDLTKFPLATGKNQAKTKLVTQTMGEFVRQRTDVIEYLEGLSSLMLLTSALT